MKSSISLLLCLGFGALIFSGCSDDVDDPIDDGSIYSHEIPEQEIFNPYPRLRCANDTETGTDSDTDTETCAGSVAVGF